MGIHSDDHLIEKIRKGSWRNYAVLIDKYNTRVFNYVLFIVRNREDAEEITQDTFVKAFRSLEQFKGESKFSTWLLRIAHNTSLTVMRKSRPVKVELAESELKSLNGNEQVIAGLEQSHLRSVLDEAMGKLKTAEKTVVTLFYLNECSVQEIAQITGLGASNVKVLLHRSRKKLLSILQKMGIEEWTN